MRRVKIFYTDSFNVLEDLVNKFLSGLDGVDDSSYSDSSHDADIQYQSDDNGFSALISYLVFPDDDEE